MNTVSQNTTPTTAILDLPLVCSLTEAELSERRIGFGALIAGAEETVELVDGYSFRFPGDASSIAQLVNIIVAERACCLFFAFALSFTPNLGPTWLHIRGPEGVKGMVEGLLAPQRAAELVTPCSCCE